MFIPLGVHSEEKKAFEIKGLHVTLPRAKDGNTDKQKIEFSLGYSDPVDADGDEFDGPVAVAPKNFVELADAKGVKTSMRGGKGKEVAIAKRIEIPAGKMLVLVCDRADVLVDLFGDYKKKP